MADKDEEAAFRYVQPQLIRVPFYNGFLTEIIGRNGRPTGKLGWTRFLTPRNKMKAVVNVYSLTSPVHVLPMPPYPPHMPPMPPIPPVPNYVVLEFAQSEKFFYSCPPPPQPPIVKLREGGLDPENAEDIRTTADPRVFLMKPKNFGDSSGVMFLWHGSPRYVITVFRDPQSHAELLPEADGNEGQIFQLQSVISLSDMQETPDE